LESFASSLGIRDNVHFLGTRNDIPRVLAAFDLFALTSDNEANPVSILEAMAVGLPVVATNVGSVADSVLEGKTGFLTPTRDANAISAAWQNLLSDLDRAALLGANGRKRVLECGSLQRMVEGYQELITDLYSTKCQRRRGCCSGRKRDTITPGVSNTKIPRQS
jgi:glycosyltransferase involved in cell wall biosynthesis